MAVQVNTHIVSPTTPSLTIARQSQLADINIEIAEKVTRERIMIYLKTMEEISELMRSSATTKQSEDEHENQYSEDGIFIITPNSSDYMTNYLKVQQDMIQSDLSSINSLNLQMAQMAKNAEALNDATTIAVQAQINTNDEITSLLQKLLSVPTYASKGMQIFNYVLLGLGIGLLIVGIIAGCILTGGTLLAAIVPVVIGVLGAATGMAGGTIQLMQGASELQRAHYTGQIATVQKTLGDPNQLQTIMQSGTTFLTNNMDRNSEQAQTWSKSLLQSLEMIGAYFRDLKAFTNAM